MGREVTNRSIAMSTARLTGAGDEGGARGVARDPLTLRSIVCVERVERNLDTDADRVRQTATIWEDS